MYRDGCCRQAGATAPRSIAKGKNMSLTNPRSMIKLSSTMATALLVAGIAGGCGKTGIEESTAERVKRVEEQQRTNANFHLERKAGVAAAPRAPQPLKSTPTDLASGDSPANTKVR